MKQYATEILNFLPNLLFSFFIFCFFIFIGNIFFRIYKNKVVNFSDNNALFLLLGKIIKTVFLLLGLITSLGTLGIDVSALVAGIGLSGFAISFATKDILSNLISGVLILLYKPFIINDYIEVDKYKGDVKEINLRYTVLSFENNDILIPNSLLYSKPVLVSKSA